VLVSFLNLSLLSLFSPKPCFMVITGSVPDPPDSHVFWPPGSESTSQRY